MTQLTCGSRCRCGLSWNDLNDFDLIHAACALAHYLVPVTNNVKHFHGFKAYNSRTGRRNIAEVQFLH
jgi:predicted nucleic acid-binding protein